MNIGLGIFLSAILLGTIVLYHRTKDRWEWEKIIPAFTAIVVSISIAGGIGVFIYNRMSDKPKIQTSLWDINLSNSKTTIKFIKGQPTERGDEDYWVYEDETMGFSTVYFIKFKEDQVFYIGCLEDRYGDGPGIQRIKRGSSLEDVTKMFGEPSYISGSNDASKRLYLYDTYNVFLCLKKNRVTVYGIYNPKFGPVKLGKYIPDQ